MAKARSRRDRTAELGVGARCRSPDAGNRYARQSVLPEIGEVGQVRLREAHVLCVGAGGLGSAALPYLAGAGVGRITVIDPDRVTLSNLHRQVLFRERDLGTSKAEAAARHLRERNSEIEVVGLDDALDPGNVEALLGEHDIVLDGSDNFETKYLLGDATVRLGRPLVHGSATGMEAMVAVLDARCGPCLRCLFPRPPHAPTADCAGAGVLGPLVGLAGCLQATETVKLIVAGGGHAPVDHLTGWLWVFDARDMLPRRLRVRPRSEGCVCTGDAAAVPEPLDASPPLVDVPDALLMDTAVWVDVREPDEYVRGHLPGAINRPLSELREGRIELPRGEHFVLYCAAGHRSRTAARILTAADVTGVRCLPGGLEAWHGSLEVAASASATRTT